MYIYCDCICGFCCTGERVTHFMWKIDKKLKICFCVEKKDNRGTTGKKKNKNLCPAENILCGDKFNFSGANTLAYYFVVDNIELCYGDRIARGDKFFFFFFFF